MFTGGKFKRSSLKVFVTVDGNSLKKSFIIPSIDLPNPLFIFTSVMALLKFCFELLFDRTNSNCVPSQLPASKFQTSYVIAARMTESPIQKRQNFRIW